MYQVMGEYGYSIEQILMVDIIPDKAVRLAMNEINAGKYNLCLLWLHLAYPLFLSLRVLEHTDIK